MPRLAAALVTAILPAACGGPGEESDTRTLFTEITADSGIPVRSSPWPDGRYRVPEISLGGIAVFDPDGDGDLDIYQVCHPPPDRPGATAPNRLYRQEAPGAFVEAAGEAGLDEPGYANGVALGDVDGDGDLDVYITNVGRDALLLNDGKGRFTDHTAAAGLLDERWSTCAAFVDFDRDGDLDLYVSRYLVDDPSRVCREGLDRRRDYCGPGRYQAVPDALYRNEGDVTFADISAPAGIDLARPGFAVVCLDFTDDGWPDIYVANDMRPNWLWVNRRDGTFVDEAGERGLALSGAGKVEASMGVAVGEVNGDGELDLFATHIVDQTNTLYLATGADGLFVDRSASSGLGGPSLGTTAWGCVLADLDLDGSSDVAVVNGRIARGPTHPAARVGEFWNPYAEPNQLFLNDGTGRFTDVSAQAGTFASCVEVSRALAAGDLDGDGDLDLVAADVGNVLRVYRNDAPRPGAHWLAVRGVAGRVDALGAVVRLEVAGRRLARPILGSQGFASAGAPIAHFGLGGASRVDEVEVTWPDGAREAFAVGEVDRTVVLRRGEGNLREAPAAGPDGASTRRR